MKPGKNFALVAPEYITGKVNTESCEGDFAGDFAASFGGVFLEFMEFWEIQKSV